MLSGKRFPDQAGFFLHFVMNVSTHVRAQSVRGLWSMFLALALIKPNVIFYNSPWILEIQEVELLLFHHGGEFGGISAMFTNPRNGRDV